MIDTIIKTIAVLIPLGGLGWVLYMKYTKWDKETKANIEFLNKNRKLINYQYEQLGLPIPFPDEFKIN